MGVAAAHDPAWARSLAAGLEALGIAADPDRQRRLLDYVALIERWNRAYNLPAVREPAQMITTIDPISGRDIGDLAGKPCTVDGNIVM